MTQPGRGFGRIPPETTELLQRTVATIRDRVATALPTTSPPDWRSGTMEMMLAVVLRDWRENGNTTGLLDSDINDLRNFISLAADLTGGQLNDDGRVIYLGVLKGLLEDWLANWNAEDDPGPPGPID